MLSQPKVIPVSEDYLKVTTANICVKKMQNIRWYAGGRNIRFKIWKVSIHRASIHNVYTGTITLIYKNYKKPIN
jgi:hypothetical protein